MKIKKTILLFAIILLVIFFAKNSLFAWTGPTSAPPSANISTPVNLTSTSQVKSGGFWASAIGSTAGYCINGSCISTWPVFPWTPNANGVSYTGGNVGIGTASPVAKLDVNGYMRLATNASAPLCNTNRKGAIALTNGALMCICNGTSWIFDYNGAACSWSATDIAPPTVSTTAPSNGATVSGTIAVSATASDNVGVVGVQFKLDGANLSTEDTTSPYSISWNTTTATNGSHTLTAVARDAAGNTTTSTAVTVTVSNVVAGSQSYTSTGTFNFVIPLYNALTVEVWGAGGGASGGKYYHNYSAGGAGGTSSFGGWGATGGGGGVAASNQGPYWMYYYPAVGGVGGYGYDSSTNLTGQAGGTDYGGAGANGGAGGANGTWGTSPGGGGGGSGDSGGGGGGGYASYTYAPGALSVGSQVTVTVGAGGNGASAGCCTGGSGAPGRVTITWN